MNRHAITLAALAAMTLAAAPAASAQDPSPAPVTDAEPEDFSGAGLVDQIVRIGVASGNRLALDNPGQLVAQIETRYDQLNAMADADGGQWGFDFNVNFSTDTPASDPCAEPVEITLTTRQPLELVGTLCRSIITDDEATSLVQNRILGAPFGEQTLYITADTTMSAESVAVRDAGSEFLVAMANDIMEALILTPNPETSADRVEWQVLVDSLMAGSDGFMHFPDPETVAAQLSAASRVMEEEAFRLNSDWAVNFAIDGKNTETDEDRLDPDTLQEISRPATPDWCVPGSPVLATDAGGVERLWQHCTGTPPGEDPATLSVRKTWFEEETATSLLWFEITGVGTTDTAELQARLDAMNWNAMRILADGMVIDPQGQSPAASE
ncbi:hypothetical protein [Maricaulis maris]|uniref:hypothetical protein n=1 Tax=Maricaulis maris TaxID=74318 RepID=UPI00292750B9|nr:hypothetical protein MACH15_06540 [Maricaulis maris]